MPPRREPFSLKKKKKAPVAIETDWTCVRSDSPAPAGDVKIWWGHTPADAAWACNTWLPDSCAAGCVATPGKPTPPPTTVPVATKSLPVSAHGPHTGALVAVLPVEDIAKSNGGAWKGKARMKKSSIVDFQGAKALRVFMKKGSGTSSMPNPDQSGMAIECRHPEIAGQTAVVVGFDLYFDPDNWHFTKGGKIGGLFVGPGVASGYRHSDDGASHRMMWQDRGAAISYIYPPSKLKQADKKLTPTGHGVGYFGDSPFGEGTLKPGKWTHVEIGVKINTFDASGKPNPDGWSMLTIDGKSGVLNNIKWAASPKLRIDNFGWNVFAGGPDPAVVDSVMYARNFEIYRWKS